MCHPLHLIDAQLFNHKGWHPRVYATCQTNGSISHCCILCYRHFQSQMCESILLLALSKSIFLPQEKSLLLRLKFEGKFYSYFLHWCIKSSNSGELLLISEVSENTMSHVIS